MKPIEPLFQAAAEAHEAPAESNQERNAAIVRDVQAGLGLRAVGKKYGLSSERVRQIVWVARYPKSAPVAPVTGHAQMQGGGMLVWSDEQLLACLAAMERARRQQLDEMRCGRCSSWRKPEAKYDTSMGQCVNDDAVEGMTGIASSMRPPSTYTARNFGCRFFTAKPLGDKGADIPIASHNEGSHS